MDSVTATRRTTIRDLLKHLRAPTPLSLLGALGGVAAGYAIVFAVSTELSKTQAGLFFTFTSAFLLAARVLTLGAEATLVRVAADAQLSGRPDDLSAPLASSLRWSALATLILLGLLALASELLDLTPGVPDWTATAYVVLAASLFFAVASASLLAVTRGLGRLRETILLDSLIRPALQVALVAFGLAAGWQLSTLGIAWSIPFAVSAVAALVAVRARTRPGGQQGTRERQDLVAGFWRYTRPRSVGAVLSAGLERMDIILAAALVSPAGAAVYTVANRLGAFASVPSQAVGQAFQPRLARAAAAGDLPQLRDLARRGAWECLLLSGPLYLLLIVLGQVLLHYFADGRYEEAFPALVVLCLGGLLASAPGPVDKTLVLLGATTVSMASAGTALATLVLTSLLLAPHLGVLGVALAMAGATVIRNAMGLVVLHRRWRVHPVSPGLAWAGAGLVLGIVAVPVGFSKLVSLALPTSVIIGVSATVVVALLVVMRKENTRRGRAR